MYNALYHYFGFFAFYIFANLNFGIFYYRQMTTEGGGISDDLIGGNASAEGGAEALEEGSVSGCDIVIANKLEETSYSKKKDYQLEVKVFYFIIYF